VGTPSITINGELSFIDPIPRMRIVLLLPGEPEFVIITPAARPCKASAILDTGLSLMAALPTDTDEPVRSFLRCTP